MSLKLCSECGNVMGYNSWFDAYYCTSCGHVDLHLTEHKFIQKYCNNCGSQRCEGIGSEWFDGCKFKDYLNK